jgi:hypothetical protein
VYGILGLGRESSSTLIDDLCKNSSKLEHMVAEFGRLTMSNQNQVGMEIRCFYETRPTQLSNAVSRNLPVKLEELVGSFNCHSNWTDVRKVSGQILSLFGLP